MLLTWPCRRDLILQRLFYTQPMHLPYPNIVKIGVLMVILVTFQKAEAPTIYPVKWGKEAYRKILVQIWGKFL